MWCISGKKITTYDCIIFEEKQACPIIETVVFLGQQNISLRGHRDDGLLGGMGAPFPLYPPLITVSQSLTPILRNAFSLLQSAAEQKPAHAGAHST